MTKAVQSEILPPNMVSSVEEFKEFVLDENLRYLEYKKQLEAEHQEEVPLPIVIYVLLDDFSIFKTMLFPTDSQDKRILVMAVKREITNINNSENVKNYTSQNILTGALCIEAFLGSYKMTEEDKKLSEEDLEAKAAQFYRDNKVTKVLIQFEAYATRQIDIRAYSLIDPCIRVEDEELTIELNKAFNDPQSKNSNESYMKSLFDWSPDQELDTLGGNLNTTIDNFNIKTAVEFIQDLLKDK